ncbi:MAG: AAA family ATPase [Ruminiclostridium sp.]
MEILYIWVENHKLIKKQGFNFGGKYLFTVKEDEAKQKYILSVNDNPNYLDNFFDEKNVINNITAIVGENGAGKTTLLKAIYHNMKYNMLIAYLHEEKVYVQHSINNLYCDESTPEIVIQNIRSSDKSEIIRLRHKMFSYVYLTNSMYTYDVENFKHDSDIDQLQLTPHSINELAYKFYTTILPKAGLFYTKLITGFNEFENDEEFSENVGLNIFQNLILEDAINTNSFQQICDLKYDYYLISSKIENDYISKIKNKTNIKIKAGIDIYSDYISKYNHKETSGYSERGIISREAKQILDNAFDKFNYIVLSSTENSNEKTIETILSRNLILELLIAINLADTDKQELRFSFSKIIETLLEKLKDKEELYDYYKNAYKEIKEFKALSKAYNFTEHSSSDLSSDPDSELIFSPQESNKGKHQYFKLLDYINKAVHSKRSFILKYINFQDIHLSSGQRAMQNFFSWLNLLRWFDPICPDLLKGLKENVVLLIDEIDLYSHPEWQRLFIKKLTDDISRQFSNNQVQIIFTTHSPLVLSDIPRNNTIYMKQTTEGCVSDNSIESKHRETFASELYSLLNDSFYLKNGIIGEFARQKIKYIIDSLQLGEAEESQNGTVESNKNTKQKQNSLQYKNIEIEQLNRFEKEIAIIGDRILQEKIYEMLDNYKARKSDELINKKIKELEQQRAIIDERIKQLKGNSE